MDISFLAQLQGLAIAIFKTIPHMRSFLSCYFSYALISELTKHKIGVFSQQVKPLECEADHLHPSTEEVNAWHGDKLSQGQLYILFNLIISRDHGVWHCAFKE
jgi:hypothetical protein